MHAHSSNLAVLQGPITSAPTVRELPGGTTVVTFDVTTPLPDRARSTTSVPVAAHDPSPSALAAITAAFDGGVEVVVIGTVRRRFFRAAGVTQSRTEVIADRVVPGTRRTTARSALAAVAAALAA